MRIQSVKYERGYQLLIEFDDGMLIDADFQQFLLSARNPMTRQFLDKRLFKKAKIEAGSLSWIGEMDIHYLDLYYDRIPRLVIKKLHTP